MHLHVVEPKTAEQLYNRLREIEKIQIRAASADGLEYLRTRDFASDGPVSPEVMQEVAARCHKDMADMTKAASRWQTTTWAI